MNLTDLLTQLAAAAPNICELVDGMQTLFGIKIRDDKNNLVYRRLVYSDLPEPLSLIALGDLAWLDMAIRREIVNRKWYYQQTYKPNLQKYDTEIRDQRRVSRDGLESLLVAFLAVVEVKDD